MQNKALDVHHHELIVYLEPTPANPLHNPLIEFFAATKTHFGHTSAHAYHVHCSITGFFNISFRDDECVRDVIQMALNADRLENEGPIVYPPLIPLNNPEVVILPLRPSDRLVDFAKRIGSYAEDSDNMVVTSFVRPKRCDHISLAYFSPSDLEAVSASTSVLNDHNERCRQINLIHDMANKLLGSLWRGSDGTQGAQFPGWDTVLYERLKRAKNALEGDVHEFRELGRWDVG
ncbi:hypothetical protein DFS34DRAFT_645863 [Phlyctochytrium arcticum]|nr:hypothetical protein DFS34DRAFT_645863 [Phlyctochytrium arcticum]